MCYQYLCYYVCIVVCPELFPFCSLGLSPTHVLKRRSPTEWKITNHSLPSVDVIKPTRMETLYINGLRKSYSHQWRTLAQLTFISTFAPE